MWPWLYVNGNPLDSGPVCKPFPRKTKKGYHKFHALKSLLPYINLATGNAQSLQQPANPEHQKEKPLWHCKTPNHRLPFSPLPSYLPSIPRTPLSTKARRVTELHADSELHTQERDWSLMKLDWCFQKHALACRSHTKTFQRDSRAAEGETSKRKAGYIKLLASFPTTRHTEVESCLVKSSHRSNSASAKFSWT